MDNFSGAKSFGQVQNNQHVINAIKKLHRRVKLLSIATYNFSTLYINIPQNKLKKCYDERADQILF